MLYRAEEMSLKHLLLLTEREKERLKEAQRQTEKELKRQREYCAQNQIGLALWQDDSYPLRLKEIYNPPYGLFYRGRLPDKNLCTVGIVGARNCSFYGKTAAEKIGKELAAAGIAVISGLAAGIDGAAQRGAVHAGGYTLGVLGNGIDVCYPPQNRELYEQLLTKGCVVSEYPPGTTPLPGYFPQRNRIISGLSDCVLVVEAREKSGSLITADFALEQGKDVYALPGRISDALSQGTNRLIRQGAGIFLNVEDFLNEMHIFTKAGDNSSLKPKNSLENLERLVYSCLGFTPRSLEYLLTETNLSLGVLMENLETLQEKGCVSEVYKNYYSRCDI
ncbi:DNA-protecting protein DprA [Lachnospiraceae bacterium]|nr:DNA-protecting protein DprA [Lachnospiraceae bacterium]